ncbi:MAG: hypothetical protein U1D33_04535 [bacterium]|nr:hypothetical protein [bacterium]
MPTLLGLQGRAVFEADAVAAALLQANLADPAVQYNIVAISEGLEGADPTAAEAFKTAMVLAVNGGSPDTVATARERLSAIIGNTPQRDWFRAARFATDKDAPEIIAHMYLDDMERLALKVLDAVYGLSRDDRTGLERINRKLQVAMKGMTSLKAAVAAQSPDREWLNTLFTSGTQFGAALSSVITMELDKLQRGQEWDNTLRRIFRFHTHIAKTVLGTQGFRVRHVLREVADNLIYWFHNNFPVRRWEHGRLVMINTCGRIWDGGAHLRPETWPPHPDREPILQKHLKLLGWTLTVQDRVDHVMAVLDFGENRLASPPQKGLLKNARGEFELASLTPEMVALMPPKEQRALTAQLTQALEHLPTTVAMLSQQLKEGDVEGLARLENHLKAERQRLSDLFPEI